MDMKNLVRTIRYARELRVPVLVHVITVKGNGYDPAVEAPEKYHGVSAFDPDNGVESGEGERTPASISFVPSAAGLIIAGEVIKDLIQE